MITTRSTLVTNPTHASNTRRRFEPNRFAPVATLALACVALVASWAHASSAARLVAARRGLERAVYAPGPEALLKARADFEALSNAEPKKASLHYWVALADWRVVPRFAADKKSGARYCKDGIAHADQALAIDPKLAEAMALRASLQGLSLTFDQSNMMAIAQDMEQGLRRAETLAPSNPRVFFFDGINTLHKPAFVGGGPAPALAKFKHALELFAAETVTDSLAPAWGRVDANIWAGRAALGARDFTAAREFYQHALEIDPRNGWVSGTLIPELDQAEKTATAAASTSVHADSSAQAKDTPPAASKP
jgi:tetratricopeptide (TPR) repeat protein